jgi:molybdopterin converting factor small subunit
MNINVDMSSFFSQYTGGVVNMTVAGKTVGECLQDLAKQYPVLKKLLLNKEGELMHTYDYYINGSSVFPRDMKKPLKNGDRLSILYVIHGG